MSANTNGGNFWQGASQAGIVAAFNHGMHETDDENPYKCLEKRLREMGWKPGMPLPAVDRLDPDYTIESTIITSTALRNGGKLVPTGSQLAQFIVKNESWLNKGNWWRLGKGHNPIIGAKDIRLAWGAHPKFLNQVPKYLQPLNKWVRNLGEGHYHFPNLRP